MDLPWRYGEGGMGWAPLPWEARYHEGIGIEWNGGFAVDVDFELEESMQFVFVGRDHFFDHDYRVVVYDREASPPRFYEHSGIHAGYRVDPRPLCCPEGSGHEHVAAMTHHESMQSRPVHEMRVAEEHHNIPGRVAWNTLNFAQTAEHARPDGPLSDPGMENAGASRLGDPRSSRRSNSGPPRADRAGRKPVQHTAQRPAGQTARSPCQKIKNRSNTLSSLLEAPMSMGSCTLSMR